MNKICGPAIINGGKMQYQLNDMSTVCQFPNNLPDYLALHFPSESGMMNFPTLSKFQCNRF